MGLKFTREYKDIIADFSGGVYLIDNFFDFFGMDNSDWAQMPKSERKELVKTLSDDLFYALDSEDTISIGSGSIKYDKMNSEILIFNNEALVKTVSLVG